MNNNSNDDDKDNSNNNNNGIHKDERNNRWREGQVLVRKKNTELGTICNTVLPF